MLPHPLLPPSASTQLETMALSQQAWQVLRSGILKERNDECLSLEVHDDLRRVVYLGRLKVGGAKTSLWFGLLGFLHSIQG